MREIREGERVDMMERRERGKDKKERREIIVLIKIVYKISGMESEGVERIRRKG